MEEMPTFGQNERTLVNTTRVQDDLSLDRSNFRVLRVARQPDSKQLGWRVFRPCDSPSHTRARYNHSTIYALECGNAVSCRLGAYEVTRYERLLRC
jgi:hypothetical protein